VLCEQNKRCAARIIIQPCNMVTIRSNIDAANSTDTTMEVFIVPGGANRLSRCSSKMTRLGRTTNQEHSTQPDILENLVTRTDLNDLNKTTQQTLHRKDHELLHESNIHHYTFTFKKISPKKVQRLKRGICCLGWIFCFPVFCLGWALRDSPLDRQDLQEDDCYPCFTDTGAVDE